MHKKGYLAMLTSTKLDDEHNEPRFLYVFLTFSFSHHVLSRCELHNAEIGHHQQDLESICLESIVISCPLACTLRIRNVHR
jgi:hypothetical protein